MVTNSTGLRFRSVLACLLIGTLVGFSAQVTAGQAFSNYVQTNLVSDLAGMAKVQDTHLVNPWGMAISGNGTIWVADNGSGVSTLYDTTGDPNSRVVTVPLPPGSAASNAAPTGIVFNSTGDFIVVSGNNAGPAAFIFATEDGTISGWNRSVDDTHAILTVNNSVAGAVYKGLAIGTAATANFIYATNFHAGTVDVFDATFKPVMAGAFVDSKIPKGFAPFGIRNLNGELYVTYAKQNAELHDDIAGKGNGYINIFNTNGVLLRRFASKKGLNSPWGMDLACSNFGSFNGALMVGNFGDGTITAFDFNGKALGQLQSAPKTPIVISGLWGLTFGPDTSTRNTLFFTAGINSEKNGLFGTLTLAPVP